MANILKYTKVLLANSLIPLKHYNDNNKFSGTYFMLFPSTLDGRNKPYLNKFNIKFSPIDGMHIEQAVKESIKISNEYKVNTWMRFNGIEIVIDYPIQFNDSTIQKIVDDYLKRYHSFAITHSNCIGA